MDEMSLAVVGLDYANADRAKTNRRFEMMLCAPGEPVHLVPEPRNKHDRRAVAVVSTRGIQLGYLTAERCGWIGARIQSEKYEAVFQEPGHSAAVIRIRFGGGTMSLPPPTPLAPCLDYDEYADAEGPFWGA